MKRNTSISIVFLLIIVLFTSGCSSGTEKKTDESVIPKTGLWFDVGFDGKNTQTAAIYFEVGPGENESEVVIEHFTFRCIIGGLMSENVRVAYLRNLDPNVRVTWNGNFHYDYLSLSDKVTFSGKFDTPEHGVVTYNIERCDGENVVNKAENIEIELYDPNR